MTPSSSDAGGADGAAADGAAADGAAPPIRIRPDGRLETEVEYQARMAHNSYMRFSRSLRRSLSALNAI